MDIHGKIREVLAEVLRDERGPARQSLSEADLLRALHRRGIIDDVMKDLHFTHVDLSHVWKPSDFNSDFT